MKKTGVIIALLSLIISACGGYKDIEFRGTENFQFGKLEGKSVSFSFDAKVFNTNNYTLKIKPSTLDVYIDNLHMGEIQLDNRLKIRRNSESLITIPLSVELGPGALVNLTTVLLKKEVNIRLKGTVRVGVSMFTKKEEIDETRQISTKDLKLGLF